MNTNTEIQKIKEQLDMAIKMPANMDFDNFGKAIMKIISDKSVFIEKTVRGFKFSINGVCFRLTFTEGRNRLVIQYRHFEAIEWKNGNFNLKKRNKLNEIINKINIILSKKVTPFD